MRRISTAGVGIAAIASVALAAAAPAAAAELDRKTTFAEDFEQDLYRFEVSRDGRAAYRAAYHNLVNGIVFRGKDASCYEQPAPDPDPAVSSTRPAPRRRSGLACRMRHGFGRDETRPSRCALEGHAELVCPAGASPAGRSWSYSDAPRFRTRRSASLQKGTDAAGLLGRRLGRS